MSETSKLRGITSSDVLLPWLHRNPDLTVEPLAERLWTASDGRARVIFAEGERGVVAFDTLGTPGAAIALREAIARTVPGKTVSTIVYSHDHLDASGWAATLAPDAEIVAHEATAEIVRLRGADGQRPVDRVVRGESEGLVLDGVDVELCYPGPTHGTGNLAVVFSRANTLFMSGTALPNARYGFFPDVHVGSYVRSMRALFAQTDFETFVPGRFAPMDRSAAVFAVDYVEALDVACQQAYLEPDVFIWVMDMVGAWVAERLRPRFGQLDGFERHVPLGAFRFVHHYLMGGWGREDTRAGGWTLFQPEAT